MKTSLKCENNKIFMRGRERGKKKSNFHMPKCVKRSSLQISSYVTQLKWMKHQTRYLLFTKVKDTLNEGFLEISYVRVTKPKRCAHSAGEKKDWKFPPSFIVFFFPKYIVKKQNIKN